MLTQRAWLLGFVAFCFYLIAVVNTLPSFYYVLMWLAIGLLAASLGIAFLSLSGLSFAWKLGASRGHAAPPVEDVKGEAGRDLAVPVVEATLGNRGSLNKTGIIVDVSLRDQLRGSDVWLGYLLEAVPAGQSLEIALPLRDLPRGGYTLRGAQLIGSDVLGLFRARRRVELAGEAQIVVAPALLPAAARALGRCGRDRRGAARRAQPGSGDELHGTRPYVTGDDLRHIHWKTTARTGELVMREWEQIGQAATVVVWDGARGSEWGRGACNSTECALVLVASLLAGFADLGLPCALAMMGEQASFTGPINGPARSNMRGADVLHAEQFEVLAGARAQREGALGEALARNWSDSQLRSAILVSASLAPDVAQTVRELLARNVSVHAVLVDAAALGTASADPRFGTRRAPQTPRQLFLGEHPVTSQAYREQAERLRRLGAQVTVCAPGAPGEVWPALQNALGHVLDAGTAGAARGALAVQPAAAGEGLDFR